MRTASVWDNQDITDRAAVLWSGYSAAEISTKLSNEFGIYISRNAIISKVTRMGLSCKGRRTAVASTPREPRTPKPRIRAKVVRPVLPAEVIKLRCAEITPRGLSLMELETSDCRYPFGEGPFAFCGHPKQEGSSYCFAHFHLTRGDGTASERAATKVATHLLAVA